jgi:hypothetical protein
MIQYLFPLILFPADRKDQQADTLPFCQIYRNKEKIKEFTIAGNQPTISLKWNTIKAEDSLHIKYLTDTQCKSCSYELRITTDNKISGFQGPSNTNRISLGLQQLAKLQTDNNRRPLTLFLIERIGYKQHKETALFTLQIE